MQSLTKSEQDPPEQYSMIIHRFAPLRKDAKYLMHYNQELLLIELVRPEMIVQVYEVPWTGGCRVKRRRGKGAYSLHTNAILRLCFFLR